MGRTTSIHARPVKHGSEYHNTQREHLKYVRHDLSANNQSWTAGKISDVTRRCREMHKRINGRKLQSNAAPVREAVVVMDENTTMDDLMRLGERIEQELGIRMFQCHIHRDEGHYDRETGEWRPNLHAHLLLEWYDEKSAKMIRLKPAQMSRLQDITAETLHMQRGEKSSKEWVSALEFKAQRHEEEARKCEKEANAAKDKAKEWLNFASKAHKYVQSTSSKIKELDALISKKNSLLEKIDVRLQDVAHMPRIQGMTTHFWKNSNGECFAGARVDGRLFVTVPMRDYDYYLLTAKKADRDELVDKYLNAPVRQRLSLPLTQEEQRRRIGMRR